MNKAGSILVWMMIVVIISTGCTDEITPASSASQTIAPPLNPYQAKTSTPGPTSTETPNPTEHLVLPTPTPFVHVIQAGDTLYALALQYNVSLDRLVSVNPDLDTSMLSVGTKVIIPLEDTDDFGVSMPTPHPVEIGDPVCLPTKEGGAWCFVIVNNVLDITLENILVGINIYDDDKDLVKSYTAIPPLDYYFPGQEIPVSVFIQFPQPEDYQVKAVLHTALPSEIDEPNTKIINQDIKYNDSKSLAEVSGSVKVNRSLLEEDQEDQTWVVAIAYHEGNVVGIRKWVNKDPISPDKDLPFEFTVYSLGPPIDEIQLFSELH